MKTRNCPDQLVRRSFLGGEAAVVGRHEVWHQARRFSNGASIGSASFCFCSDSAHRRFEWLVLCQCSLVVSSAVDLLVGGVGLRRGRRDPHTLSAGDALDFWRVETFVPDHELGLVAEMKVPGRAWLQFEWNQ